MGIIPVLSDPTEFLSPGVGSTLKRSGFKLGDGFSRKKWL
jgi:hypothetical protein